MTVACSDRCGSQPLALIFSENSKTLESVKAVYPRVLRQSLRERRLYVPIEAGVVGRVLREGERFTVTIECTTSTLDIRSVVPRIGSTLQVRGAISEAQVILQPSQGRSSLTDQGYSAAS